MRVLAIFAICFTLLAGSIGHTQISRSSEGIARQVLSIRTMIDSFTAAIQARMQAVEDEVALITGRMDTVEGRMDTVETNLSALTTTVSGMQGTLSNHERRITALENRTPTTTTPTNGCNGQVVRWGQCSVRINAMPHGTASVIRDVATGDICTSRTQSIGQVRVACNNGRLTQTNARCSQQNVYNASQCAPAARRCNATTVTWSANGRTCRASIGSTADGSTRAVSYDQGNTTPGQYNITGTATFECDDGTFRRRGSSCTRSRNAAANCQGRTMSWTVNGNTCRASFPSTPDGTTSRRTDPDRTAECENVNDTTGSATFRCDNGTFRRNSGATCRAVRSRYTGDCR